MSGSTGLRTTLTLCIAVASFICVKNLIKSISLLADGGLRDALGLLDKLSSEDLKNIDLKDEKTIKEITKKAGEEALFKLSLPRMNKDLVELINENLTLDALKREDARARIANGEKYVVRQTIPSYGTTSFDDEVYGPNFEPLAEALIDLKLEPVVVCESAGNQDLDALYMKNYYFSKLNSNG